MARHIPGDRLQPRRHGRADADGHKVQRLEDLTVGRVTRLSQSDAGTAVKQGGKGQKEGTRRPACDHDPTGIKVQTVPVAVVPGDPGPQGRQAQPDGVAKGISLHLARQIIQRRLGRAGAGLADLHVDDVTALGFGLAGGLHDIHHDEGIDQPAG